MLHYYCPESEWKGAYTHWVGRHRSSCTTCNSDMTWRELSQLESKQQLQHMHFFDTSTGHIQSPFHSFLAQSCITILKCAHNMYVCCHVVPPPMQRWIDENALLESKTGLSRDELYFVWSCVKYRLVDHYESHHSRSRTPISPFASLLITLHYLRHYPTEESLALEFGVSQSTMSEHLRHTIHSLFITLVPQCFNDYPMPHRGFVEGCLDKVRLVVDSTWITLPHHKHSADRKMLHHMKAPNHQGLKWQLTTTTTGEPWHVSSVVVGSKADITLLRESGVLDLLSDDVMIVGDKGYQGESQILTPTKKPKGGEVTEEDAADNKIIDSKRVVVENAFHIFKQWAILGQEYRGDWRTEVDLQHVTEIVHVIASLVKKHMERHPIRADPTAAVQH